MVLAHHFILTGYGHWLPNDPRGSLSKRVDLRMLRQTGEHHYGRKPIQPTAKELQEFHRKARQPLRHCVLWFNEPERAALVRGIARVVQEQRLTCYAGAVLDNHVHVLIRRHRLRGDEILSILKTVLAEEIHQAGLFPPEHPVISDDSCDIFKDDPQSIRTCIAYINENFAKHKLPLVIYPFVQDYDGWTPSGWGPYRK